VWREPAERDYEEAQRKTADLDKLKTELAKVSTVILSTFQGITVEDDTKLRRAVQAAGGKYKVVKNTLAERAGAGTPAENLLKNLSGTNSIAYTWPTRSRWPRRSRKLPRISGVSVQVRRCGRPRHFHQGDSAACESAVEEELISKIMFLLNAPAQRIAMALNALPRIWGNCQRSHQGQQVWVQRAGAAPSTEPAPKRLSKFNF